MLDVRRGSQVLLGLAMLAAGPATAAIDVTNRWVFDFDPPGLIDCLVPIQQTGTAIDVNGGCANAILGFAGTINTTTGAFVGSGTVVAGEPPQSFSCVLDGMASPSGTALTGAIDCVEAFVTFTAGLCRNGDLDAGEACDDGFDTHGCCTSTCTPEPDTTPCTKAGGCQTGEACSSGVCVGTPRPSGSACDLDHSACTEDICDGAGTCDHGPCSACCEEGSGGSCFFDAACTHPIVAQSIFKLTTNTPDGRADRLVWKLPKLADTSLAEFGDPTTSTNVAVCPFYYDEVFGPRLLTAFRAPAGTTCGSRPCWKATRTGFTYRDREKTPDGLTSIQMKSGADGRARIVVKGRGSNLPDWPGLPHQPLGVLLRAGDRCWGADFLNPTDQPGAIDASDGQ